MTNHMQPFCANFAFKSNVDDVAILMRAAETAKNADTPFIAQADTQIIGLESMMAFSDTRTLAVSENTAEGKLLEYAARSGRSGIPGTNGPAADGPAALWRA